MWVDAGNYNIESHDGGFIIANYSDWQILPSHVSTSIGSTKLAALSRLDPVFGTVEEAEIAISKIKD